MCARQEQSKLFDLFKAFNHIESSHKSDSFCSKRPIILPFPIPLLNDGRKQEKTVHKLQSFGIYIYIFCISYFISLNKSKKICCNGCPKSAVRGGKTQTDRQADLLSGS